MKLTHLVWPLWADVMACFAVTSFVLSLVMAVALVAPRSVEDEPEQPPALVVEPELEPIEEPDPEPVPEPVIEPDPAPQPTGGTFSTWPLDLVIMPDSSSSMKPCFEEIKLTLTLLAPAAARACEPEPFRLGIVRLRRVGNTEFKPLTRMGTVRKFRGPGARSLLAWVDDDTETITIVEGSVGESSGTPTGETRLVPWFSTAISKISHQHGLATARKLFEDSSDGTRKLVVVIGDQAGWLEDDPNAQVVLDEIAAGAAEGICWSFIFTGDEAATNPHLEEARAGFRRMAEAAGERGSYAETTRLLPAEILGQIMRVK